MQYIATIADDNITTELYSFVASLRTAGYQDIVLVCSPEGHNPPSLPSNCKQVSIPMWWPESFTAANTAALIKPDIFLDADVGDTVLYMDSADLVVYCDPERIFEQLGDKLLLAHQYKTKRNKYNKLFPVEISDRLGLNRNILPPDRVVNSGVICAKVTDRLKSAMYLWRAILKQIPDIGALMHHNRVGDQLGFNYIFRQLEAEGRVEFLPEEYNYRPGIAVSKLQFKHGLPITRHQKPIYVPHSTGCRKLPDKIRWNASEGIKQKPSNLKIDVITPAYKATETFVTRYLQSIAKQTIEPDNVLIGIDNCEQTRRNLQKAKPFTNQVKTFWFPEHCGPYLIRNTLAEISDADVLLFFDIDDEMMPQYVARLGICCSSGTVLVPCSQWIKNGKVIRKNYSSYCQFGIKRQDFLVLNGFEPWECHADYEFQVRAKQHGIKWHKLNTVLFNQYKHNNNLTVREDTKHGSNKRNYYDSIVEERKKHPITKQTLETTEYELAKSNKTNNQSNKFIRQRDHELDRKLIVSLTSFPPRFKTLPLSLDCLLSQTIRPDKVILWIAEKDTSKLTHSIEHREGLEIKSVPGNIKSYKKIIPALKKYPDAYIVTADDDLYYPPQWLENMVCPLKEHGDQYVYAHRVHRIQLKNGEPKPYRQWKNEITETGHHPLNFSTNGAGTLFPPGALNADVLDESLFMSLCPHADDLWLYWQLRRQKTQVYKVLSSFELAFLPGSQKGSLKYRNVFDGGNDRQIQNLINYYGFPSEE